jgi:hypothetical protein
VLRTCDGSGMSRRATWRLKHTRIPERPVPDRSVHEGRLACFHPSGWPGASKPSPLAEGLSWRHPHSWTWGPACAAVSDRAPPSRNSRKLKALPSLLRRRANVLSNSRLPERLLEPFRPFTALQVPHPRRAWPPFRSLYLVTDSIRTGGGGRRR